MRTILGGCQGVLTTRLSTAPPRLAILMSDLSVRRSVGQARTQPLAGDQARPRRWTGSGALVELLGDPQKAYPVVHLTGTNGKTSTARMVDALLREAGLRTGRFTSPHLESVPRADQLDGEPIDAQRFVEVYAEIAPYAESGRRRAASTRCRSSR